MKKPVIHPSAFVADNATVRGSVALGANSSVFFGAVLRGDRAPITIGAGTNIQDNCVVHVDYDHPVTVGENVTVGHGAILHGCTVGDNTLIGMGAIVLNGANVGSNCLIGAGGAGTAERGDSGRVFGLRLPRQDQRPAGRGRHCRAAAGGAGLPEGGHCIQDRAGTIKICAPTKSRCAWLKSGPRLCRGPLTV